jgi:hypothetical protein
MEPKRRADEVNASRSGDNSLITKGEMRCMIQELMEMGLIGSKNKHRSFRDEIGTCAK